MSFIFQFSQSVSHGYPTFLGRYPSWAVCILCYRSGADWLRQDSLLYLDRYWAFRTFMSHKDAIYIPRYAYSVPWVSHVPGEVSFVGCLHSVLSLRRRHPLLRQPPLTRPEAVCWTLEAVYPGQTVCASTACGSLILGITAGGAIAQAQTSSPSPTSSHSAQFTVPAEANIAPAVM
jgi:hypothetical protein